MLDSIHDMTLLFWNVGFGVKPYNSRDIVMGTITFITLPYLFVNLFEILQGVSLERASAPGLRPGNIFA